MTGKELYEKYKGFKMGDGGVVCGYENSFNSIIIGTDGEGTMGYWRKKRLGEDDVIFGDFRKYSYRSMHEVKAELEPTQSQIPQLEILILSGGKLPTQATSGAIGYDVYAREIIYEEDGEYVKVKLGFKTSFSEEYYCELPPRSNITDTGWGMCNSVGDIDSDFRGEWQARFRPYKNSKNKPFPYSVGDRVAQFIFKKKEPFSFKVVSELSETARGEGGHGHTGLK